MCELLHLDCHRDSLRKATAVTEYSGYKVMQYYKEKLEQLKLSNSTVDEDSYMKELNLKRQELEKEKTKHRDERNELNRILRGQARYETMFELLEDNIKYNGKTTLIPKQKEIATSDNDLFVSISDVHLGAENYSMFGCYNSDIAKERLTEYLEEILNIAKLHNSEKCYVGMLGDLINNNIHKTIAISNRENVIEQIQLCSELLSAFVFELSNHFNEVIINDVSGNHSRIDKKDDALKDERLDKLISWYMKAKLSHVANVKFIDDRYDSTIATMSIRDNTYLMVHGDYDGFNKNGVANLVMMLGFKPTGIFYGHLHTCSMSEISGIKIIRSGSFSGTGDEYCIQKRIKGIASQMVCVCTERGIKACYPIDFTK